MVTYYNEGDMYDYGRYLLSQGRLNAFKSSQTDEMPNTSEERMKEIFGSDFPNWKDFIERKRWHDKGCDIQELVHPGDGECTCHRADVNWFPGKK